MNKINTFKINRNNFLFSISYILFVFTLFNRDVSNIDVFYQILTPAKYTALFILMYAIISKSYSKRQIILIFVLLSVDILVLIRSGSLIFIMISLFSLFALKLKDNDVLHISYNTLLFFTLCVFAFTIFGIYEDQITNRWVGSVARHTLGFYHSNVLPLIYSYLVGYGLLTNIFQKKHYILLLLVNIFIFYICGSRNSLVITFLLVFGKWFIDSIGNVKYKKIINNILRFVSKIIVPLLTIISVLVPLYLEKIQFFSFLDYIFSYRFTYISKMIQNIGISLIPNMTNTIYFKNEIVIDNGYAFLILRYGILMSIFLSILTYSVAKKYENNTFVLLLIIIVACCNFIDNDLIDYSVLPYLIISEKCLIEGHRGRRKYGRSNKRNNEYLQ